MSKEDLKDKTIINLIKVLQEEGQKVQTTGTPPLDQITIMDIIIDTMRFLKDYDENVAVLNSYYRSKPKYTKEER